MVDLDDNELYANVLQLPHKKKQGKPVEHLVVVKKPEEEVVMCDPPSKTGWNMMWILALIVLLLIVWYMRKRYEERELVPEGVGDFLGARFVVR